MKVTKKALRSAVEAGILSDSQADQLIEHLSHQPTQGPAFTFTYVLYYLGGLVAIGAMTLFMTLGWETLGGAGIVMISLLYAGVGLALSHRFSAKRLPIPAGICATFVVCLTPLAIYGFQQWLGVWPDDSVYRDYHRYIKWHWLYMELGTLAVGTYMVWKYRYPFLILPIAVTLWYMTMDVAAMITERDLTWEFRSLVSLYSGLLMIVVAVWMDVRWYKKADYAFWIYLFGVIAFWGGLSSQYSDSELSKFVYFCINLCLIGVGVLLVRKVFVVFGALGCCGYLGHLASDVFSDSWLFPAALTVIGLGIIYLGVLWQTHEKAITHASRACLPAPIRALLEAKSNP